LALSGKGDVLFRYIFYTATSTINTRIQLFIRDVLRIFRYLLTSTLLSMKNQTKKDPIT